LISRTVPAAPSIFSYWPAVILPQAPPCRQHNASCATGAAEVAPEMVVFPQRHGEVRQYQQFFEALALFADSSVAARARRVRACLRLAACAAKAICGSVAAPRSAAKTGAGSSIQVG